MARSLAPVIVQRIMSFMKALLRLPNFLQKQFFHLSLSHSHLCAIRSFVLLIDHNVRGGMWRDRHFKEAQGEKWKQFALY